MADLDQHIEHYYGSRSVRVRIETALLETGKNLQTLSILDLAPVDQFHTRGRESTLELAALAKISQGDRVLDVGCGLGGTARLLAQEFGCRVVGIDLTRDFVEAGNWLSGLVGLEERVEILRASALTLPFGPAECDFVWTEHAQMNISDKHRFYGEISRTLKPGGCFLFHDIFRGANEPVLYPVPWAEEASISSLVSESEAQARMQEVGLVVDHWASKVRESIDFFDDVTTRVAREGLPAVGIHLLMGDNAGLKLQNYLQNLKEGRVTVAMGMAQKARLT